MHGDALQGAWVKLAGPAGSPPRTVQSGTDGQFEFTGLPNIYKLTVTAPGMSTFTSSEIPLRAGEFRIAGYAGWRNIPLLQERNFQRVHYTESLTQRGAAKQQIPPS